MRVSSTASGGSSANVACPSSTLVAAAAEDTSETVAQAPESLTPYSLFLWIGSQGRLVLQSVPLVAPLSETILEARWLDSFVPWLLAISVLVNLLVLSMQRRTAWQ